MKKIFAVCLLLFTLISFDNANGAPQKTTAPLILQGNVLFEVETDQNPLTYKVGEPIKFNVSAILDGNKPVKGFVKFKREGDDGVKDSGVIPLVDGKAVYETKLSAPGFVRLQFNLLNEKRRTLYSTDGSEKISYKFDGSAGADVDKIPQMPEPEDFDAFWQKQKEKLASVPVKAEKVSINDAPDNDDFDTYAVSVDCAGPCPVTGFLQIPKDAKPGSLPAYIHFDGYGLHIPKIRKPGANRITLRINAHGVPLQQDKEFYANFFAPLKGYALKDGADPETCYFNGMVMRVLRSLQYVKTLPEWDGKNLVVIGNSQGGLQSLWAAGLDGDVSKCEVSAPWGCNIGAEKIGLMGRTNVHMDYYPARGYYDAVHHAKRIKCPVNITRAGLGDFTCPPAGVISVYNNIKTPKSIIWYQNISHSPKTLDDVQSFRFQSE